MSEQNKTVAGIDQEKFGAEVAQACKTIFSGGTLRDLKGVTDGEMEALYAIAYNYYTTGHYAEADKLFRFLVRLDHTNAKMWIGLGAVQQVRKDFANAVTSYGYASFLDLENPKPQYYAAQCFLALGDLKSAESALAALDAYAPKGSPFREKAKKLQERIDKAKAAV